MIASLWQPIETAPRGKMVLVYGNGGVMLGYLDQLGNWRQRHHGPHRSTPSFWQLLPSAPVAVSK